MTRPLVPRDWKTTDAITAAKKPPLTVTVRLKGGKKIAAFNGSQTRKSSKKRPITLPSIDKISG